MLKSLFTLVRGTANRAVDKTIDQNALLILDQQIRDCGDAIGTARKALAIAIAQDRREQDRIGKLEREIADLETVPRRRSKRGGRNWQPRQPKPSPRLRTSMMPRPRHNQTSPASASVCAGLSAQQSRDFVISNAGAERRPRTTRCSNCATRASLPDKAIGTHCRKRKRPLPGFSRASASWTRQRVPWRSSTPRPAQVR